MSRSEFYPWSQLEVPGDYFTISEELKPYSYMAMMVSQRNYKNKDQRYTVAKYSGGTVVMLASVFDRAPPIDVEIGPGLGIKRMDRRIVDVQEVDGVEVFSPRSRTQEEIVARMSLDEKLENLPWWWENGKVRVGLTINRRDRRRYVHDRNPFPDQNVPYPEDYGLDENLRATKVKKFDVATRLEDDDEEEDWGDDPIITGEDGDDNPEAAYGVDNVDES